MFRLRTSVFRAKEGCRFSTRGLCGPFAHFGGVSWSSERKEEEFLAGGFSPRPARRAKEIAKR